MTVGQPSERQVVEYEDGEIDEEGAIAVLLDAGQVFISGAHENCTVFVGFHDVFWWATADGEDLPRTEIANVYRAWQADPVWGVIKWACKRRNMRPQWPMVKSMIEEGKWDAELNALPSRLDDPSDHGWKAEHEETATQALAASSLPPER